MMQLQALIDAVNERRTIDKTDFEGKEKQLSRWYDNAEFVFVPLRKGSTKGVLTTHPEYYLSMNSKRWAYSYPII